MSDCEDDYFTTNQYSFQKTVICGKGPNNTNASIYSFGNNLPSSTMHLQHRNSRRPLYGEMNYDQRSFYKRRETSPMSLYNERELFRPPYHHPYGARSFKDHQRSVFNGRSGSSLRSFDSTASVSATEIAFAFKNANFNKYDLRLIKNAFNKYLKNQWKERVDNRWNRRVIVRDRRDDSLDDLGGLESDSSLSSDNSISPRTIHKDTLICNSNNRYNKYKGYMQNENYLSDNCQNGNRMMVQQTTFAPLEKPFLLKDRLNKKEFMFPAQRFSEAPIGPSFSDAFTSSSISCSNNKLSHRDNLSAKTLNQNMESEEEIFSEMASNEVSNQGSKASNKRNIDLDGIQSNPNCKKTKIDTLNNLNCLDINTKNDFKFAKPQRPIRKTRKAITKNVSPEIVIPTSHCPADIEKSSQSELSIINEPLSQVSTEDPGNNNISDKRSSDNGSMKTNSNDVSKRPSFIKRKLYTQKLDIAETKTDTDMQNSPEVNKYCNGNKEKNKTRKLASSRSCLSRDVLAEDDNYLDLLHKIIPADQLNLINATNNISTETSNRNSQSDTNAKWDVTSVISTCNDNDGSETFTDEDIVKTVEKADNKTKSNIRMQSNGTSNCKVVLNRIEKETLTNITNKQSNDNGIKGSTKNTKTCNTFWDTDFETDIENDIMHHKEISRQRSKTIPNQSENKYRTKTSKSGSIWGTDLESDTENDNSLPHKEISKTKSDPNLNKNKNKKEREEIKVSSTATAKAKSAEKVKNNTKDVAKVKKSNRIAKNTQDITKKNNLSQTNFNNSNISDRSLRSNSSLKNLNDKLKPSELFKAATLLSHTMGRTKRQCRTKPMNTTGSSTKKLEVSTEFNISINSLRPRKKKITNNTK